MSKPKRIFISHSTKDRDFVDREIISLLRRHGIETWYSKDDIQTASQWKRVIVEGLKSCDWFLVGLSPRSIVSPWVEAEVDWAFDHRQDRIVPVIIEDCTWDEFNLLLRTLQNVNFSADPQNARIRLLQTWGIQGVPSLVDDSATPFLGRNLSHAPAKPKRTEPRTSDQADRIELQCPNGHRLTGKPSLRGKSVKCPACSISFVVPKEGSHSKRTAPVESATIPKVTSGAKQLPKFIDVAQAAAMLGITKDELLQMRSVGDVHGFRDRDEWKFKTQEIERLRDANGR